MELRCADCGCLVDRGVRVETCGNADCCCTDLPRRSDLEATAAQIREALNTRNLDELYDLLAEDVRWGTDDHPRKCRSRSDVLKTFKRQLAEGVRGTVDETITGARGVACRFQVEWPDPADRRRGVRFFHVYILSGDKIAEIQRHDDRESVEAALAPISN
jgi:hypothetical protein